MTSRAVRRRPRTAHPAALVLLAALLATGCSTAPSDPATGSPSGSSATPTASSASPSGTPSASSASPSSASPSSPLTGFSSAPVSGGTSWPGPAQARLVRVAVGSHEGYDRLVLEFAEGPVPEYDVTPQQHATFPQDPSDLPVELEGDSGVRVVVRGTVLAASAADHLQPAYPAIREVERIGDFEAVVSYGVGVAGVARVRVTTLASPPRLVVDVRWP